MCILGSGPRYQILSHFLHVVRVKKHTAMRESQAKFDTSGHCLVHMFTICPHMIMHMLNIFFA